MNIVIDFETCSTVDLLARGLKHYAQVPFTKVLMMGYKCEDEPARLWLPGQSLPEWISELHQHHIYAFNAEFELAIWNNVFKYYTTMDMLPGGVVQHMPYLEVKNVTCIQALCARVGLPQNLAQAAEVLKTPVRKDPLGKQLIKHFCIPPFGDKVGANWNAFKQYCLDDVEAEYGVLKKLPATKLDAEERWVWEETVKMNKRGIPIDYDSAKQIRRVTENYREAHYELLPELTDGLITKISQTKRIIQFCESRGVALPDCTAHTVAAALERDDLPADVVQLLDMRAQLGLSSVGKYIRMENMCCEGRIHYNQRYHGAHTGRWTGTGVQLLNLPRAKVEDPEAEIAKFFDGSIVEENPVKSARALIRPMIKAPVNHLLYVADYSAIEYVVLEWFAGNYEALDRFEAGYDQYIDQASAMYGVPYEAIEPEQRRTGKVVVLGCGYGQGAVKLQITADKQWGMKIDEPTAQFLVNGYRRAHNQVVKMWYTLAQVIVNAVASPGSKLKAYDCEFQVRKDHTGCTWLAFTLPSGRSLYYRQPFLESGVRGPEICHWGYSQTTKQWCVQRLIPGRIVENIVQAASRDILIEGLKQCARRGLRVIWSVYDEIIVEALNTAPEQTWAMLKDCMETRPEWAKRIPIKATGYYSRRYKKG